MADLEVYKNLSPEKGKDVPVCDYVGRAQVTSAVLIEK